MRRDLVAVTAIVALAGTGAVKAAEDEPDVHDAPAVLAHALRSGTVEADEAAAITRWILSEKDDTVARGLALALRSTDMKTRGAEGETWNATARAMAALFEGALGDAAARRPRDSQRWPELAALVGAAAPAIAQALGETSPAERETLQRLVQAMAPSATPMLPHLLQGLRHPQPEVRRGAAMALGALGQAGRRAAADLRHALDDPDPGVRAAAADALRRVEGASPADPPRN
jgi:hypothetical protein